MIRVRVVIPLFPPPVSVCNVWGMNFQLHVRYLSAGKPQMWMMIGLDGFMIFVRYV